jgi:hypothetical protein
MADRKIVYLILERGMEPNKQTFWRNAGVAYECRDGSLNVKLDIHPGLTFNVRDPKSNGEQAEIEQGSEDEDGQVFPCDICRIATTIDEAHLLSGGGAVCEKCFQSKYKDCLTCNNAFPKAIGGTVCPMCK